MALRNLVLVGGVLIGDAVAADLLATTWVVVRRANDGSVVADLGR